MERKIILGTLYVEVTFSLNDDNEFRISYIAKTDKKTVINLTHHMFVNLMGLSDPCPLIVDHILQINSNLYLPIPNNYWRNRISKFNSF